MATRKKKKPKSRSAKLSGKSKPSAAAPKETQAAEAITIAWTVTVTTLLISNLIGIAVHFYLASNPEAKRMLLLQELLLFAGAVVGMISLALILVVTRVRKVPPPRGVVLFGACVAAAPILAIAVRIFG